jgi:REP element-mobilizing transposase RayT
MPNHLHGLIEITDIDTEKKSKLGAIVRGLKIGITKWFRLNSDIEKVWQRDYFERIISDPNQFNNTKNYIEQNINKWAKKELSHKLYC